MLAIYEDASRQLVALIADAKGLKEGQRGYASKAYREARLAAIRQVLSDTQDKAVPLATELISVAYASGGTATAKQVGRAVQDFGKGVHQEAIEILADNIVNGLNGAAEAVGRYAADFYRQLGLEAATQQIVLGDTRRAASQGLIKSLEQRGLSAFTDAAGRRWELARYAQMVVRTNSTQAIVRANINTALVDGFDLVEVLVSDPCPICAEYEGEVFSLTGAKGYQTLEDFAAEGDATEPPFHPNCRCDLNVLTEDPNA